MRAVDISFSPHIKLDRLLVKAEIFVRLLKIGFFVGLDHQFMQHDDIGVGQRLYRLQAQTHNGTSILNHLDVAPGSWYTIYTLSRSRTGYFQVPMPHKLAALLRG